MRKSTEYSFGGAAFLIGGIEIALATALSSTAAPVDFGRLLLYVPMAAILVAIGGYWLVRAEKFYSLERALSVPVHSPIASRR